MSDSLHDKRIVNTRAMHQADEFDALIRARGAVPVSYPCIAVEPPDDTNALDSALRQLIDGAYDWLVLTSANTVISLKQRIDSLSLDLLKAQPFRVAVVGTSTADAATSQLGLSVDLVPDEFVAESLANALLNVGGGKIFLPESAIARPTLAEALRDGGANVHVVKAYETVCGSGGDDLRENEIDVVTFTSSSTVTYFFERLAADGLTQPDLGSVRYACIGPKTATTAHEYGLLDVIVPDTYTLSGLLDALECQLNSVSEI